MAKRRQYTPPEFQDLEVLQQELSVLDRGQLEARQRRSLQRIQSLGEFPDIETLWEQAESERVVLHLIETALACLPAEDS